jgi:uncharacterized membrane protein YuzA (DUF378 family)
MLLRGQRSFLLGEGEWERIVFESGPFLGGAYIALRCGLLLALIGTAVAALRADQALPLLLVGVTGIDLVAGPFGQPTALGFAVFITGLAFTAANPPPQAPNPPSEGPSGPALADSIPGRSPYAQRLHSTSASQPPPAA